MRCRRRRRTPPQRCAGRCRSSRDPLLVAAEATQAHPEVVARVPLDRPGVGQPAGEVDGLQRRGRRPRRSRPAQHEDLRVAAQHGRAPAARWRSAGTRLDRRARRPPAHRGRPLPSRGSAPAARGGSVGAARVGRVAPRDRDPDQLRRPVRPRRRGGPPRRPPQHPVDAAPAAGASASGTAVQELEDPLVVRQRLAEGQGLPRLLRGRDDAARARGTSPAAYQCQATRPATDPARPASAGAAVSGLGHAAVQPQPPRRAAGSPATASLQQGVAEL